MAATTEPTTERRVFLAWSIRVPVAFAETFVEDEGYWHGYDDYRSASLTSVVLRDDRGPVGARRILRQIPALDGSPVDQMPRGLVGQAVTSGAPSPAKASRILQGMLATRGRLLLVTITSDYLDWARRVWMSIRGYPAPLGVGGLNREMRRCRG